MHEVVDTGFEAIAIQEWDVLMQETVLWKQQLNSKPEKSP